MKKFNHYDDRVISDGEREPMTFGAFLDASRDCADKSDNKDRGKTWPAPPSESSKQETHVPYWDLRPDADLPG